MARYTGNKYDVGLVPITADGRDDTITVKSFATILAAGAALANGDVIDLCVIPANHSIVGLALFSGDLDSNAAPTLTFSAGLMDAGGAALDTVFVADSTLGQAGGTLAIPAATTMFTTGSAATDKVLAIEVTANAATKGAADAVIGCVVQYVAD